MCPRSFVPVARKRYAIEPSPVYAFGGALKLKPANGDVAVGVKRGALKLKRCARNAAESCRRLANRRI
jgi:hypothetical protein